MEKPINKIIILGGYGNFGKRIAKSLSRHKNITLYLAGRDPHKAETICQQLSKTSDNVKIRPLKMDIHSSQFETELIKLSPDLVIHTSGPFQAQDYRVPEACINANCHYIDLADDRRFVCDIHQLNARAQAKQLLVVSGASSVPGLSSTVIEHLSKDYQTIKKIDIAIAPGNKSERGEATLRAILSYTGKAFPCYINNSWQPVYGWMSPRQIDFAGAIGKRWLANVDVPDLELIPAAYPEATQVTFQAGLELPFLHHTMVLMAWMCKYKLVKSWVPMSQFIFKLSQLFSPFGTDIGGMRVTLEGLNKQSEQQLTNWTLTAENNIGPFIPTLPAIILANNLITNQIAQFGAKACTKLFTLGEFDHLARPMGIYHRIEKQIG